MKHLVCLITLLSSAAYAGSIHKWVDENGNTHYGDAPPATVTTQELKVDIAPSNPGKALPRLGADASEPKSSRTASNNGKSDSKVPDDQAKTACDQAQGDLKIIQSNARVRLKNQDGTSRYMTTEEIKTRREKAEQDVKSFCK